MTDELLLINEKLTGIMFLEKLKYTLIEINRNFLKKNNLVMNEKYNMKT